MSAMVPGKKLEVNEGIRLLTGKPKIDVPLKKKEEPKPVAAATPAAAAPAITGPVTSRCTVEENGNRRTFTITLEPAGGAAPAAAEAPAAAPAAVAQGTPVHSTFAGSVEIVDIKVKVGDKVSTGGVIAQVEAMKATHDIKSPCDGTVAEINVSIGDEVDSTKTLMIIA
jgi:biotin carboxyl carrier protein